MRHGGGSFDWSRVGGNSSDVMKGRDEELEYQCITAPSTWARVIRRGGDKRLVYRINQAALTLDGGWEGVDIVVHTTACVVTLPENLGTRVHCRLIQQTDGQPVSVVTSGAASVLGGGPLATGGVGEELDVLVIQNATGTTAVYRTLLHSPALPPEVYGALPTTGTLTLDFSKPGLRRYPSVAATGAVTFAIGPNPREGSRIRLALVPHSAGVSLPFASFELQSYRQTDHGPLTYWAPGAEYTVDLVYDSQRGKAVFTRWPIVSAIDIPTGGIDGSKLSGGRLVSLAAGDYTVPPQSLLMSFHSQPNGTRKVFPPGVSGGDEKLLYILQNFDSVNLITFDDGTPGSPGNLREIPPGCIENRVLGQQLVGRLFAVRQRNSCRHRDDHPGHRRPEFIRRECR